MDIAVLGIDLGKTTCSVAGLDVDGMVVLRKRVQRHRLLDFLAQLAGSGITTKEVLDWLEARSPKTPRPELVIDDPALRKAAISGARNFESTRIRKRRERFEGRGLKGRDDFKTARDFRGEDRER